MAIVTSCLNSLFSRVLWEDNSVLSCEAIETNIVLGCVVIGDERPGCWTV